MAPPPAPAIGRYTGSIVPRRLGRLTWEVEPPRLGVLVQSQLTVLPDYAQWVAVLRYDVSGGGAEAVHLKLPTAWAASARVQVVGDAHQLATETRGPTPIWMIRPEHPIWGSQRLIVRSAIPLPKTGALSFPEFSPLGRWGAVDSYLALVNASGRELVTEGSPGLQPIADDSRFRAEEFAGTPGVSPSVYHVRREGWTLKVHGPGELRSTGRPPDEARVLLAEIACTLRDDGAALGLAVYEIEPRSGRFLALDPPGQSEPLWATVNNIPTPPLLVRLRTLADSHPAGRTRAGQSQVPGPGSLDLEVGPELAARRRFPSPAPARARPAEHPDVRDHPHAGRPRGKESERFARAGPTRAPGDRPPRVARTTDHRRPRQARPQLPARVRGAGLQPGPVRALKRDAQRSAHWNLTSPLAYRDLRIARLEERVKIASQALADALRNAALDEFAESARIHVGLVADRPQLVHARDPRAQYQRPDPPPRPPALLPGRVGSQGPRPQP